MQNLSFQQTSKKEPTKKLDDFRELAWNFMQNIKVGDSFFLNNKLFFVKCFGKWKSKITNDDKEYKTITVNCQSPKLLIKFFYMGGWQGNPDAKGKKVHNKQYSFLRDVEGQLIVDLVNSNNPFHEPSDIFKISKR